MLPSSLQSGLDLLHRGGWVMVPLIALSVASVTVMVERALFIREARAQSDSLVEALRTLLLEGRFEEALNQMQAARVPIGRVCSYSIGAGAILRSPAVRDHP